MLDVFNERGYIWRSSFYGDLAMFTRYKNLSDAQLEKKRKFFRKVDAIDTKMCHPLGFFGMLAAAGVASLLLPALPHLFLFSVMAAAAVAGGCRFTSTMGNLFINSEMERRYPPLPEQPVVTASSAAPAVAALPDLAEAFGKGTENAVTVRTLRYKSPTQSSFMPS
jgi:hypothetical protein